MTFIWISISVFENYVYYISVFRSQFSFEHCHSNCWPQKTMWIVCLPAHRHETAQYMNCNANKKLKKKILEQHIYEITAKYEWMNWTYIFMNEILNAKNIFHRVYAMSTDKQIGIHIVYIWEIDYVETTVAMEQEKTIKCFVKMPTIQMLHMSWT